MTEVDHIITKARKDLKEYNSQDGIYKLNDGFISTFIKNKKEEIIEERMKKLSKRRFFDSDFKHPFWVASFGAIFGFLIIFPFVLFSAIFHKLGVGHDNANLLALACAMLLGILFSSTLIENEVSSLRESAFEDGMVFESKQHIEENYEKALQKLDAE